MCMMVFRPDYPVCGVYFYSITDLLLPLFILNGIPRSLLRGFQVFPKSVPEGAKFRNTPSACGGDRNFEDFASLLVLHAKMRIQ